MILGASQCQVPLIEQAQKMGYNVIVVSMDGNYPGFLVADKSYKIDVRNHKEILKVARKENISGIITDQTDIPVLTAAYVAKALGLPGIDIECAQRFTNKYKMRRYCEQIGIPVPQYTQASSVNEALALTQNFQFPLILKPVDSQGSRGVVKVNTRKELEAVFENVIIHSSVQQVIFEEFFKGKEVVIEGFMANNEFTNLIIGDRLYFDLPNMFIPRQTIFPSQVNPELQKKLLKLNAKLIQGFAPKFGITHSEFLINEKTGDVRLVETAIRGGGVFISSDLIPLASTIDVNRPLILLASGEKFIKIDSRQIKQRAAAYLCFYLPEGQIQSVHGLQEVQAISGVQKTFLQDIKVGMFTSKITDKTMRQGPILIAGESFNDLQKIIIKVQNTLKIKVSTSKGIQNIIW